MDLPTKTKFFCYRTNERHYTTDSFSRSQTNSLLISHTKEERTYPHKKVHRHLTVVTIWCNVSNVAN